MKVLGIDDFFYVSDRSYDFLADKSLPYYHEAHKMLVSSLCFKREEEFEVIDLGVGSGVTSAYILKNYPKARITGVDLFDEMLEDAKIRLKPFEDRVTLVRGDNAEFLRTFSRKVNIVVSAFCIHHLGEAGKKELFRLIHDILLLGGRFLMLDITTFADPCLREQARQATIDHMKEHVQDEGYRAKWIHHWNNINTPHPADEMVQWAESANLQAEIVFRAREVALIAFLRGGTK